jgi:hypothetical protein
VSVLGCGTPTAPTELRAAIAPYLDEMAAYDRWARRLGIAEPAFRSEDALREAAFAPLRRRPRVAAAWLEREGPDARTLRYPDDAPALPDDGWVRVVTDELGELHAQRRRLAIGHAAERELTLVRRSRPAPDEGILHVTLAFAPAPPAEP